jgi:hypothetical protein
MKHRKLPWSVLAMALSTSAFAWLLMPVASAALTEKKTTTSKFFVADLTGDSHLETGEKVEPLIKKAVHSAAGAVLETKAKASDSLVFSNGTALYLGEETRLEIKTFLQAPFSPNRSDLDVEPSVSEMLVNVQRGSVGICTSKLVSGSAMVYTTPQATIHIRGRRLLIEVEKAETRVYLLEGDVTVLPDSLSPGETLKPGQFATLRRTGGDSPAVVSVAAIPVDQVSKIDDRIALACISRRTVYFESNDSLPAEGADGELRPVEVVPAKPPTQFTVSPSRITG